MHIKLALALTATVSAGPAFATSVHASARTSKAPGTVLLNASELAALRGRRNMLASMVERCSEQLGYQAKPIAIFAPDPHYTANGLNSSANSGKQLAADAQASYRAGLCYWITGEAKYAAVAQRILDAWSGTLTSITTGQGKSSLNFNMPYMTAAASWVRGVNGWDGVTFGRFLRTTVLPKSASDNPNNHGMWGTLVESGAAAYLGDAGLLTKARNRWIEIFKGAAAPDGTLIREVERSGTTNWRGGPDKGIKGLAYTHYFLLPASMSAKIFADQGQPVWNTEDGRLLKAAFAKAAAWTLHPQTFPFYASNKGKLEGVRSAAYFPLLLKYISNDDAKKVLNQGAIGEGGFYLPSLFGNGGTAEY